MTPSMVSSAFSFSHPSQSFDISNGNCFAKAVFWNWKRSSSWRAAISSMLSSLAKKLSTRSFSSAISIHSMASLTMLMVVNERLPRATEVFGPKRFSNTRVRHPIVATSCRYLFGSSALHSSLWLKVASRFRKLGKNLRAVTLHASS